MPIYVLTFAIPVTYLIEVIRGIVVRGVDFVDLLPQIAERTVCCILILGLSLARFRNQFALQIVEPVNLATVVLSFTQDDAICVSSDYRRRTEIRL
jgi:hypothetical protein